MPVQGDDPWGREAVLDDLMTCPAWQQRDLPGDDDGEPHGGEMFPGQRPPADDVRGPRAPGSAGAR
ncbi:MAG: hypothetical protein ABSF03_20895 [Streptosporangiaceae bacterium]